MHVESTADPQLLPTLIEKRIVITLSLGFLCWIMCVALSLFSPQSGALSRKQRSKRILKRIFITIISFIFLFTSSYIYILLNIGIDLYYHPIPVWRALSGKSSTCESSSQQRSCVCSLIPGQKQTGTKGSTRSRSSREKSEIGKTRYRLWPSQKG